MLTLGSFAFASDNSGSEGWVFRKDPASKFSESYTWDQCAVYYHRNQSGVTIEASGYYEDFNASQSLDVIDGYVMFERQSVDYKKQGKTSLYMKNKGLPNVILEECSGKFKQLPKKVTDRLPSPYSTFYR